MRVLYVKQSITWFARLLSLLWELSPGALKICLGIIQTISGLLAAIIFLTPALFENQTSKAFAYRAFTHIVHGLANILAGILEAVPFLGTIIAFIRKQFQLSPVGNSSNSCTIGGKKTLVSRAIAIESPQKGAWIGYKALLKENKICCTMSYNPKPFTEVPHFLNYKFGSNSNDSSFDSFKPDFDFFKPSCWVQV